MTHDSRLSTRFEVVRDPLWDNITLDAAAVGVLDTPTVQRLRYVRQVGHAFLVYPGATHTRFEHALGAYHLTRRALASLDQRGELDPVGPADRQAVALAALLHDIGHYPFSHGLEEAGFLSHEARGVQLLGEGALGDRLRAIGGDALVEEIGRLIRGRSASPLQGLISGTLDLDKIDYLSRDARMCGVPYGTVDVDRLLASLTLVAGGDRDGSAPRGGSAGAQREARPGGEIGVHEKGISALESLLFAKYQMYRNVYWHHAVRSATCMFKRAVRDAVRLGVVTPERVAGLTDDAFMQVLVDEGRGTLAAAVRERRLYKRALDVPASEVPEAAAWVSDDPVLLEQVEDRLALEAGLAPGELLLDFPSRPSMLSVDLPLRLRDGRVERLTEAGRAGQLGLPRIADELYRTARRLRVFTARPPARDLAGAVRVVGMPADVVSRAGPLL